MRLTITPPGQGIGVPQGADRPRTKPPASQAQGMGHTNAPAADSRSQKRLKQATARQAKALSLCFGYHGMAGAARTATRHRRATKLIPSGHPPYPHRMRLPVRPVFGLEKGSAGTAKQGVARAVACTFPAMASGIRRLLSFTDAGAAMGSAERLCHTSRLSPGSKLPWST